jgi:4-hydroxyphenylpyruvate dioxygenase-like putative hemolysin
VSQPVNRVSHVVWCVRPEHFDEVVAFWSETLGVRFEEGDIPVPGLQVKFCAESGIEVITPTSEDAPAPIREFLATHGEGVYHVMYGVTEIDTVAEKVEATGLPVVNRISYAGRPPWSERYAVLEERFFEPRHGTRVGLVEMRRLDEGE